MILEVTNVQVFPLKESTGKLRGFARVLLNDELQLTGLRIYEGVNGLFVAYPNDPSYKGEDYRQLFYPVTRDLRDSIENACVDKYTEQMANNDVVSEAQVETEAQAETEVIAEETTENCVKFGADAMVPNGGTIEYQLISGDGQEVILRSRLVFTNETALFKEFVRNGKIDENEPESAYSFPDLVELVETSV